IHGKLPLREDSTGKEKNQSERESGRQGRGGEPKAHARLLDLVGAERREAGESHRCEKHQPVVQSEAKARQTADQIQKTRSTRPHQQSHDDKSEKEPSVSSARKESNRSQWKHDGAAIRERHSGAVLAPLLNERLAVDPM